MPARPGAPHPTEVTYERVGLGARVLMRSTASIPSISASLAPFESSDQVRDERVHVLALAESAVGLPHVGRLEGEPPLLLEVRERGEHALARLADCGGGRGRVQRESVALGRLREQPGHELALGGEAPGDFCPSGTTGRKV